MSESALAVCLLLSALALGQDSVTLSGTTTTVALLRCDDKLAYEGHVYSGRMWAIAVGASCEEDQAPVELASYISAIHEAIREQPEVIWELLIVPRRSRTKVTPEVIR